MRFSLIMLSLFLSAAVFAKTGDVPASIYDFKVKALNGGTIDFSQFKGKKILIVNTPQKADWSVQYTELEKLYQQYKGKLVIVGFITQDFQTEPGSEKAPDRPRNYPVTFPMAAKVMVRGDLAPIYQWLTEKQYNHLQDSEVQWDFQKYLIDENGNLVTIFKPRVRAGSAEIQSAVQK